MKTYQLSDIRGGNAAENAQIVIDVLQGKEGAKRDIVLLNSAAALIAGNVVNDFDEGIFKAEESIDKKSALGKLDELKKLTNEL
jgi:anthranilate phosphoribosyltransferase